MPHPKNPNPSLWRRVAAFVIILFVAVILAGVSVVLAQDAQPAADRAVYLPFVVDGADAPTPTQTTVPSPTPTTVQDTPIPTATSTTIPTSTPTTAPPTPTPSVPVSEERQITSGIVTSQNAVSTTLQLRQYAVDAVYLASRLVGTGSAVTTGTVTIVDADNATYDPAPDDRLRVLFPDGRFLETVVTEIEGSSSTPGGFLTSNHRLSARVVTGAAVQNPDPNVPLPVNSNMQIFSAQDNGQTQLTVTGVTEQDGVAYTLDLASAGTYFFDSSFGGLEQRSNYTVTGTVVGGALALTVDERYVNQSVVVDGDSASLADTEIRNQWSYNGVNFQVENGLIRRSFRNGLVNENELNTRWLAQGTILQNGVNVGNLNLNIGQIYVDVVITVGGQSYNFQRFRRP